jgi:transposase
MAEKGILLSKNEQFKLSIIEDYRAGRVTREEAATLLEVDPRTISRMARRVGDHGAAGMKHGNTGRPPTNKLDEGLKAQVGDLIRNNYFDFNVCHRRDMLADRDKIQISYTSLRRISHQLGIVKHKHRRRPKQRVYRERMANEGLLWQMDGSHHDWNGKDRWCLIGIIDDASSEIVAAQFYLSEDTVNCMELMEGGVALKGIPEAVYVDKAGWFGGPKRTEFSQFGRACDELGIRVLYANSPEAKGRIERAWRTFQDRLIPEMRLYGVTDIHAANYYLQHAFLPGYWNSKLRVLPRNARNRYRELKPWHDLPQVFCRKEYRWVRHDKTIEYKAELYHIETLFDFSLRKRQVELREYRDGTWAAYLGKTPLELRRIEKPKRLWTVAS